MVNQDPRTIPWTVSASIAYALQLGKNRQLGGSTGEIHWR
jgi:hypothetical protein